MKKVFISIALLAVLGTMAISCQKENITEQANIVAENNTVYKVSYSIDGISYQITLIGDDAWHDFLERMVALTEEGHRVSFRNENTSSRVSSSKDMITYTTTSSTEAIKWSDKMTNEGYSVTIEFDERTGIYTCTAIK